MTTLRTLAALLALSLAPALVLAPVALELRGHSTTAGLRGELAP